MGYCSDQVHFLNDFIMGLTLILQAHSSVEKAGLIGLVKLRYIESDEKLSLRGDKLREAIKQDRDNGLIPFFVSRYHLEANVH